MASGDIPELVSRWKCLYAPITIPVLGLINGVPADPERLAIGFSHLLGSKVFIGPNGRPNEGFSIVIDGQGDRWFYWQKHGSLVNQAWNFISNLGADDIVFVCTITRTNIV